MKCDYERCQRPSEPLMSFDWGDYHESCLDRLTEDEQAAWSYLARYPRMVDLDAYEYDSPKRLALAGDGALR